MSKPNIYKPNMSQTSPISLSFLRHCFLFLFYDSLLDYGYIIIRENLTYQNDAVTLTFKGKSQYGYNSIE